MIISQGAEAIIRKEDDKVVKDRIVKRYRHPQLDAELRKSRARREKKILEKASSIIPTPHVYFGDDAQVVMEYLEGKQVKEVLDENHELAREIGRLLATLHKKNIIHGDLTTSNMILTDKIYFIDYGLACTSHKVEDKAVDIHLFRQALESKHHRSFTSAYRQFLKGYREEYVACEEIMQRLRQVEARGRNKAKF